MTGWVLAGAVAVVALDQATKSLALRFLSPAGAGSSGVLKLVTNGGSLFGRALSVRALLGLWLMTLACTLLVLSAGTGSSALAGAGIVVALGGATGNLLDRVGRGAVIDFIDLGFWPAFNVADVAVVAGVAVAIGSLV